MKDRIVIYTDGSCNPKQGIGAWAVILHINKEKIILSGEKEHTTHQQMELLAVIKAFEYLTTASLQVLPMTIYTDSQYVVGLQRRTLKLSASGFTTKQNLPIRNAELVYQIITYLERMSVTLIKIKAHQMGNGHVGNREVDKLSRRIVRDRIRLEKIKREAIA
ncbi:MAG: ribonuclease HI [Bacteroidia bacterium]|nr:ribonuclease HI [Bacteroidia bacterium]